MASRIKLLFKFVPKETIDDTCYIAYKIGYGIFYMQNLLQEVNDDKRYKGIYDTDNTETNKLSYCFFIVFFQSFEHDEMSVFNGVGRVIFQGWQRPVKFYSE